jgi:hypothetical protein
LVNVMLDNCVKQEVGVRNLENELNIGITSVRNKVFLVLDFIVQRSFMICTLCQV